MSDTPRTDKAKQEARTFPPRTLVVRANIVESIERGMMLREAVSIVQAALAARDMCFDADQWAALHPRRSEHSEVAK